MGESLSTTTGKTKRHKRATLASHVAAVQYYARLFFSIYRSVYRLFKRDPYEFNVPRGLVGLVYVRQRTGSRMVVLSTEKDFYFGPGWELYETI